MPTFLWTQPILGPASPAALPDPRSSRATARPVGESVRTDQHGKLLGEQHIPATLDGYQQLRQWAARWPRRCWAIDGAHGVGQASAQRLVGDGERVVRLPAKLAARVRVLLTGHRRTRDPADAISVAVAARNAGGLRQVKVEN
jgi:transposase